MGNLDQIKEDEVIEAGGDEKCMTPLRRPMHRWEDNTETDED
jgi:hypothetical protein